MDHQALERAVGELMMSPAYEEAITAHAECGEVVSGSDAAVYAGILSRARDQAQINAPDEDIIPLAVALLAYGATAEHAVNSDTEAEIARMKAEIMERASLTAWQDELDELRKLLVTFNAYPLSKQLRLLSQLYHSVQSPTYQKLSLLYMDLKEELFHDDGSYKTALSTGSVNFLRAVDAERVRFTDDVTRRACMEAAGLAIRLVIGHPFEQRMISVH